MGVLMIPVQTGRGVGGMNIDQILAAYFGKVESIFNMTVVFGVRLHKLIWNGCTEFSTICYVVSCPRSYLSAFYDTFLS